MFNNFMPQQEYQNSNIILPANSTCGALLIGDFNSAVDPSVLKSHDIKTIITAGAGFQHLVIPQNITHIVYQLKDAKNEEINRYFQQCYETIEQRRKKGGVLVHCAAGISRSATLVIAYLMKKNRIGFKEAIQNVRSQRKQVCPNLGFELQLKKYETELSRKYDSKKTIEVKNQLQNYKEAKQNKNKLQLFQFHSQEIIHSNKKPEQRVNISFRQLKTRENKGKKLEDNGLFVCGRSAQRPQSQGEGMGMQYVNGNNEKNKVFGSTWGAKRNLKMKNPLHQHK